MRRIILSLLLLIIGSNSIICSKPILSNQITKEALDSVVSIGNDWLFYMSDNVDTADIFHKKQLNYQTTPHNLWMFNVPEAASYKGIAWYSRYVSFSEDVDLNNIAINMPFSYGGYQLYLNGTLVYNSEYVKTGDEEYNGHYPTVIKLPGDIIKRNDNYLALRVGAHNGLGGFSVNGMENPYIKLGTVQSSEAEYSRFIIQYSGISFLSFFLFLFFGFRYLNRTSETYNLAFAILSLMVSLFILGYYGIINFLVPQAWGYWLLTYLTGPGIYLFTLIFFDSFLKNKRNLLSWFIIGCYSFSMIFVLIEFSLTGAPYLFVKYIYNSINMIYLLLLGYLVFYGVRSIRRKDLHSKSFFIGVLVLVLAFLQSMLSFAGIGQLPPLIGEGFFAMLLVFSFVLAKRFAQTHKDLEAAHTSLQQVDRMKDEFLANTSHELRTPLTGIIGLADSLLFASQQRLEEDEAECLRLIMANGKRLANLVNDILDYSKLKHKDLQIRQNPVSLRDVTSLVLGISQSIVGRKAIELRNEVPEDLPPVLGDEDRLQQILYNLVGNGIKFTDSGFVSVSARMENGVVMVSVRDTGIGIPENKQKVIFESFEQLDSSAARKYGGTGIGLAITKQMVELHQGTIWVDSHPGEGSEFTFTLQPTTGFPVAIDQTLTKLSSVSSPEPVAPPSLPSSQDLPSDKGHILIVDDEIVNLKVFQHQLSLTGYQVTQAQGGQEALDLLEGGMVPDLILLDVMMPGMTGYEVCRQIRENYPPDVLPILMVTAKNQVEDLVYGMEVGANDYIPKPFAREELIARINTHLSLKKMADLTRELNQNLESKVQERTHQLQEKNIRIMESIKYAGIIQSSILPTKADLAAHLEDHFIFWKPRDIVGGDFYWFYREGKDFLLAVADCTGHGVPGALMSMTASSVLSRIVVHISKDNPAKILGEMNRIIKSLLNQDEKDVFTDDGLEIGLCHFNASHKVLTYSGSRISLYYSQQGKLKRVKGDKQGLGYKRSKDKYKYTNHQIPLEGTEVFYLTTDGIIDQIGQDQKFGFGRKGLESVLQQMSSKPLEQQRQGVIQALRDHQGDQDQLDDICVMGFIPKM